MLQDSNIGPKREDTENCIMKIFMIAIHRQILFGWWNQENEMCGDYRKWVGGERCVQGFGHKNRREEITWKV